MAVVILEAKDEEPIRQLVVKLIAGSQFPKDLPLTTTRMAQSINSGEAGSQNGGGPSPEK